MQISRSSAAVALGIVLGLMLSSRGAVAQPTDRARTMAASAAYGIFEARLANGQSTPEVVYTWSVRWLDSLRDGKAKAAIVAAAATAHLDRMAALRDTVAKLIASGALASDERYAVDYYVAEAEHWVKRRGRR